MKPSLKKWAIGFGVVCGIALTALGLGLGWAVFGPPSAEMKARAAYDKAVETARQGSHDEAIGLYTRILQELDPPPKQKVAALVMRGMSFEFKLDPVRALEDYDEAVRIGPELPGGYWARSRVHAKTGRLDRAIEDIDRAIRLKPRHFTMHRDRGKFFRLRGDFASAIADFDRSLELKADDATTLSERGQALLATGAVDRAERDFDAVVRSRPDDAGAIRNRGVARMYIGADAGRSSVEDLKAAVRKAPEDLHAILWLFIAEARNGEDGIPTLRENVRHFAPDVWPVPLIRWVLGEGPFEEINASIGKAPTHDARDRLCDVSLYVGAHLAVRRDPKARKILGDGLKFCSRESMAFASVHGEIALLGVADGKPGPK